MDRNGAVKFGRHCALGNEKAMFCTMTTINGRHDRSLDVAHGELVSQLLGNDDVALCVEADVHVIARRDM